MAEAINAFTPRPQQAWSRGAVSSLGSYSTARDPGIQAGHSQVPLGRFYPPVPARHAAEWEKGRGEVVTLAAGAPCEMEFLLPAHLVLMFIDGSSTVCELSDGQEARKMALAGGAMLFNPTHEYLRIHKKTHNRCRILLVAIDPDNIRRLADADLDAPQVQFHGEIDFRDEAVHRTLLDLQDEIEHPGPSSKSYCQILTLLLLTQLVRCASNLAPPRRLAQVKGGLPNWRLKRALEMLNRGLNETPTLSELAGQVDLHPSAFCRAFKQSMGVSPHRYLVQLRIARAKELMANQALTLTQIALECGFNGSSHFSVAFRGITGMAPRMYRKSL
jgi:AraC-like DNA-binding protein